MGTLQANHGIHSYSTSAENGVKRVHFLCNSTCLVLAIRKISKC